MKIRFEKILVPNFIRTDKGNFSLIELSDDEFEEYIKCWTFRLRERKKEMLQHRTR